MKYISFNPYYVLKPDDGRVLVMSKFLGRNLLTGVDDSFTNVIHPIYAMILSFIDGREYEDCIIDAATSLEVSKELIGNFVAALLDNPNRTLLKSQNMPSAFPPQTIISLPSRTDNKRYYPSLFNYTNIDLCLKRHMTPSTITLMLNNTCMTDCIYCYQDKRKVATCQIPLDRIIELIQEAKQLNVNTFDVIGGEFFLYKHWRDVLKELRSCGFNPYISTKVPLDESDIKFLSDLDIHDIQISLDSAIEEHLQSSLRVKVGYLKKMIESIQMLDHYGVPIMLHSVLTKFNDSIEDMESVFNVIKDLKHIVNWHVVIGEPSLYPKTDLDISINPNELNTIVDYLNSLKTDISINVPAKIELMEIPNNDRTVDFQTLKNTFFSRSFCSGLFSSIYILPDGQVSMCEQLYWNKDFIVGSILHNSLLEVWNSEKSKSIYYLKQGDIPSDSKCHTCNYFDQCRSQRQVCYREIIRKYGAKKWYYPDVNCPFTNQSNIFNHEI